jgi:hypothetical protein
MSLHIAIFIVVHKVGQYLLIEIYTGDYPLYPIIALTTTDLRARGDIDP